MTESIGHTYVVAELVELSSSRGFDFFLRVVQTIALIVIAIGIWFV